ATTKDDLPARALQRAIAPTALGHVVERELSNPAEESQDAKPKPAPLPGSTQEPSSTQRKPDRARTSDHRPARGPSSNPPMRIQVKPVFFVPRGEAEPTRQQQRLLANHLDWCRNRYGQMLGGRDNFTLAGGPLLIHRSRTSLAQLKAAPEMGAPRVTGE